MEVLMNHFQGSSKSLPPLDSDRNTRISRKICQSEFAWCILLYQPLFPISSVKRRNGSKRHFECLSERVTQFHPMVYHNYPCQLALLGPSTSSVVTSDDAQHSLSENNHGSAATNWGIHDRL